MKKIVLACDIKDFPDITKIKGFVPCQQYSLEQLKDMGMRELGSVFNSGIQFSIHGFLPQSLYDLKCLWLGNGMGDPKELNSLPREKIVIVNDQVDRVAEKRTYQMILSMLMEWIAESSDSWPLNFKIYTGVHQGRWAVFAEYIPIQKEVKE